MEIIVLSGQSLATAMPVVSCYAFKGEKICTTYTVGRETRRRVTVCVPISLFISFGVDFVHPLNARLNAGRSL
jgi:hypothetical protein